MVPKYLSEKVLFLFLFCLFLSIPHQAIATQRDCEPELTAVFLMGGIYPGPDLSLDLLHITEVGPATYPSETELLEIVTQFYADDPFSPYYNHQPGALAGNFQFFLAEPGDFGAVTIVDIRDGSVVFASAMVWMGFGETVHPTASTHQWIWAAGFPAAEPAGVAILPSWGWSDEYFGSQEDFTQVSLDHLRQTDVMRSFGSCAPYQVTSYIHTPSVGVTNPLVALQVMIISGHAGPPWGPEPITTTAASWDMVKAVYR